MAVYHRTALGVLASVWAVPAALSSAAIAQTAAPDPLVPVTSETAPAAATGQRYTAADLARFSPRTALDLVEQIPGFAITGGNGGGGRGLGAARENVLINGARLTDKSTDAGTALSRIAIASVAYVDIVDGASLNVPGLTGQVANVVLVAGGGDAGWKTTLRWTPEIRPRIADNWFAGELSARGRLGGSDLTISLTNNANRNGHWGPERVSNANGSLRFVRDEFGRYSGDRPRLAVALSRTAANGNIFNINLAGQLAFNRNHVTGVSTQPGVGLVNEDFRQSEHEWNADFGGDYEFALGKGRLKLIAQTRFEHSPSSSIFQVDRTGLARQASRFSQTADESETIIRGEFGWRTSGGTDWQLAVEGAYNLLDVDAEFATLDASGQFQPVAFGGEITRVDEKRGEASLTWGRAIAPDLTAQINLGAEYSLLTSSGPGGLTRSFIRPKGRLALAWKIDPKTTINYVLQRRVEQLDFFDFASVVDLANNNGNVGNGTLVPPIIDRTELEIIHDFGAWGNASLAVALARPKGLVDQIPLSPTTEGRGNLPRSKVSRMSVRATLLLDPVGLRGVKLNADASLRHGRVRDPLTGETRPQSGGQKYNFDLNLRHDIPGTNWAWGANIFDERESAEYRLDEISDGFTVGPFITAFVEHKNVAGFTVRAEFRNLANMRDANDRTIYVNRRDGPIDFFESSRRGFGRLFRLTVSGTL